MKLLSGVNIYSHSLHSRQISEFCRRSRGLTGLHHQSRHKTSGHGRAAGAQSVPHTPRILTLPSMLKTVALRSGASLYRTTPLFLSAAAARRTFVTSVSRHNELKSKKTSEESFAGTEGLHISAIYAAYTYDSH